MSISPNIPSPQESYQYESSGTPRWIAVLFGVVIAALAVLGIAGYSTQSRLSQDLAKQQDQNKILIAQLDQANSRRPRAAPNPSARNSKRRTRNSPRSSLRLKRKTKKKSARWPPRSVAPKKTSKPQKPIWKQPKANSSAAWAT